MPGSIGAAVYAVKYHETSNPYQQVALMPYENPFRIFSRLFTGITELFNSIIGCCRPKPRNLEDLWGQKGASIGSLANSTSPSPPSPQTPQSP
jgi:hypothetical protein